MAGDPFKKVRRGDPLVISAEVFNTFIDVAQAFRRNRLNLQRHLGSRRRSATSLVRVRNRTGTVLNRYAVVAIDRPTIDPVENESEFVNAVVLDGVVPDAAIHTGRFAVLQEPAQPNVVVRAVVAGPTIVRVNILSASHQFADVSDGETTRLESREAGAARILWSEPLDGDPPQEKWAVVNILGGAGDALQRVLVSLRQSHIYRGRVVGPDNRPLDPNAPLEDVYCFRYPSDATLDECVPLIPLDQGEQSVVPVVRATFQSTILGDDVPVTRWVCLFPFIGLCFVQGVDVFAPPQP